MINGDKELRQRMRQWRAYDWEIEGFLELLDGLLAKGCSGVIEKLGSEFPRIDHTPSKFRDLWSELKIAEVLIRTGHKVTLLGEHMPDIEAFRNGRRAFVEVARKSADTIFWRMYEPDSLLSGVLARLPIRIQFIRASEMGAPAIGREQRLEREDRVRKLEEWLVAQLQCLDLDTLPITLKGNGVDVEVERHSEVPGYIRGGVSDVFMVPQEEAKGSLLHEVKKKSGKHRRARESDLDACYVVALNIEESIIQPFYLLSILYGPLIYLDRESKHCRFVPSPYEKKILEAQRTGWGDCLDTLQFEIEKPEAVKSAGLFLEDDIRGVDAVLALYPYTVQLAPNLFSGSRKTLAMRDWFPFPNVISGIDLSRRL